MREYYNRHDDKSRYEEIAELQRAFYNRDSEEILTCTLHAHPILSGPEDFCKSDSSISFGPGYVLPKKKNPETGAYEGWEFITPASEPARGAATITHYHVEVTFPDGSVKQLTEACDDRAKAFRDVTTHIHAVPADAVLRVKEVPYERPKRAKKA